MIPDMGPHAAFIWAAYAIAAALIGLVIVWLIADGRRLERQLADYDRHRKDGREET